MSRTISALRRCLRVRYKTVRRNDGTFASPSDSDGQAGSEITSGTLQVTTMGGEIESEDSPENADVSTMLGSLIPNDELAAV